MNRVLIKVEGSLQEGSNDVCINRYFEVDAPRGMTAVVIEQFIRGLQEFVPDELDEALEHIIYEEEKRT